MLREKEEREWYGCNSHDYYAIQYRQRIRRILRAIRRYAPGPGILEVGCAQSVISLCCAEAGFTAAALDIRFDFLIYSRLKYERGTIDWIQGSVASLPFRENTFDCIVLAEILEHCAWPERVLITARSLLKQGGVLIVTTPNNSSDRSTIGSFSSVSHNRTAIEHVQFGPDGDDHLFTFSMNELHSMVAAAGFDVCEKRFIGNHFLQLGFLYHIRHLLPWIWNSLFEALIPVIPLLGPRFTNGIFMVARRNHG